MSVFSIRQEITELLKGEGYHHVCDASQTGDIPSSLTDRSFLIEVLSLRPAREAADANDVWYYEMNFNIRFLYRLNLSNVFATSGNVLQEVEALLKTLLHPENQPNEAITFDLSQVSFETINRQPEVLIAVMEFKTLYRVARSES